MTKRWYYLVLIALIAGLVLVACGGGEEPAAEGESTESGETTEETTGTDEEGSAEVVSLDLARFFGDCDDTTAGVTDVTQATSECEVIQILTNLFNAEHATIQVERLGGAEWGTYYDALNTTFAGGTPPDVAVMHGSNMPDYTSRDLLRPVGDELTAAGVDTGDWTEPARGAVTYQDNIYGIPFDLHANLWHLNVDLFEQAGLVDDEGNPILPSSREEFMEHAQIMQETTGATYLVTDASQFPIGVRIMFTLVWQQGSDLISEDGTTATVDTPESSEALDFMLEMFEQGYSNPEHNYDASQEAFLTGNAAVLHNGTWAVDQYNREAEFTYKVVDFPTLYEQPAVWANSHMWVVPRQPEGEAKYDAAIEFLTFLNDHVEDWAVGTGHLASRQSVLNSESYAQAPQRANYADTANIARLVPAILNWQATEDILKEELESTWLTGKDPDQALQDAEARINDELGG
ncbi:MAG: ABC transporter substrate-binding protein [Candidatus Promineifilaceae bacterium]|nr:ABC transporter substrate-binding protein [Candidatus Promineifilaceae bacterium]